MGLLLVVGLALAVLLGDRSRFTVDQVLPFVVAFGLLLVAPLVRGVNALLERIRAPRRRGLLVGGAVAMLVALAVIVGVPLARGYELIPRSHDEHMHLLQMQMLARGRLWMPPLPEAVADHFETFFVLTRPVYASIYFPGTSLLLTPTVWLSLPYWVMPAVYSALAVGLTYLVLAEVLDGVSGALGAMLLLSSSVFREMALLPMSHNLTLMLALAVTYAWLRWRAALSAAPPATSVRRVWPWSAAAGALAGLMAITRPVEAICYVAPLAVASVFMLRRVPRRVVVTSILAAVVAALPLVALQFAFNLGTTGRLLYMPYQLYVDTQQPRTGYGFYPLEPEVRPQSSLPQKQIYYEEFHIPIVRRHQPAWVMLMFLVERLPLLLMITVTHPLLLLALPLGLIALREVRDRAAAVAMLAALAMLILGYTFNALLLSHYFTVWMPPVILLMLLAPLGVAGAFPRLAGMMPAATLLVLLAAAVSAQPGLNPRAQKQWTSPELSDVHDKLATLPHTPAVVLFRFSPGVNVHHEPVYNVEAAWPDDAMIVRAHDLGERNIELFRYYAQHQPERYFYRYDRATRRLEELGRAGALLERMEATMRPEPRP